MVALRWGSATDTGRVREANEDSLLVASPFFAVADGMGGHAAGEVASAIAVESLRANATPTIEGVVEAIKLANRAVLERAGEEPSMRGMGTTLSAVTLIDGDNGEELLVTNVGDSRVYRLHLGELEQLSEDHSLVEELVREGRITAAEARVHPNRNIVTRVLGGDDDVEVDWWAITPATGDRYLLCSDGLVDEVDDHEIARVLLTVEDPEDASRTLVEMANTAGGRDNITVVIVDVVDDGGRAQSASAAVAKERSSTRSAPLIRETEPAEPASGAGAASAIPATVKPKRLTWRVVVFLVAIVLVVGAAAGGTAWFARNTYYIGVDAKGQVTIYRGRPGGVLWIKSTVEEETGLDLGDIQPARRDEVMGNHEVSTRAQAERYLQNITTTTTTVPTTTSTTTTVPTTTSTVAP